VRYEPPFKDMPHHPTGPWWRRLLGALRLARENWTLRRPELPPLDQRAGFYDDIDRLLPPRCDGKHGGTPCADALCHVRFQDEEAPRG
jgi:hypothetical protein